MLQGIFRGTGGLRGRRDNGMSPALRRGAAVSAALHVVLLLILIFGLPMLVTPPEAPPETEVAMVFEGTQSSQKGPTPGQAQAPTPSPTPTPQPSSPEPPLPTPPLPPPPPPPLRPAPAVPSPPKPAPPTQQPPPEPTPAPSPVKPPPPAPRTPPKPQAAPAPPLPRPPPRVVPPPSPPSSTSQPNPTKNPAPDSTALDNTLERLRSSLKQGDTKNRTAAQHGGAATAGGGPRDDTAGLSAGQRGAVGDSVRRCWTTDAGMLDLDKMQVLLSVTTDASGTVRMAAVAPEDQGRVSGNPRLRVFSERAVRAVLDPQCANLPLPSAMLGQTRVFTFRFRP